MHTIPSAYYTLDSSARTITLSGIYAAVEFEQIVSITDLTTSDNLYDVGINRDGVSMVGSVITYNTDNSVPANADTVRIIVDDIGKVSIQAIDDGVLEDICGHDCCLSVISYIQRIGHNLGDESVEFAIGKKSAIGSGAYTLLESQAFVQPVGDLQMYAQSTSAQDSAGGTGAQEVTVEYFPDVWGARKITKFVPTGTSQVTLGAADINRIHKVYINKGHNADGNITITNIGATSVYGGISQYESFMRRCIFYIAENESVTVTQVIGGSTTSGGVNMVLFASQEDADGNVVTRGQRTIEIANNTLDPEFVPWITISNENNKKKSVGLAVNGNLANQKSTATITGFIEDME